MKNEELKKIKDIIRRYVLKLPSDNTFNIKECFNEIDKSLPEQEELK